MAGTSQLGMWAPKNVLSVPWQSLGDEVPSLHPWCGFPHLYNTQVQTLVTGLSLLIKSLPQVSLLCPLRSQRSW